MRFAWGARRLIVGASMAEGFSEASSPANAIPYADHCTLGQEIDAFACPCYAVS
jgi:hypothetical protein